MIPSRYIEYLVTFSSDFHIRNKCNIRVKLLCHGFILQLELHTIELEERALLDKKLPAAVTQDILNFLVDENTNLLTYMGVFRLPLSRLNSYHA